MPFKNASYRTSATPLRRLFAALFCAVLFLGCVHAQQSVAVPQLVKYAGTIPGTSSGTTGVIFALYKDQTGGAPLWQEVQSVPVDSSGHYVAFLGVGSRHGLPVDLFSSGEARWLGVQAQGQAEQARVLLVSVPYAMKASDAETLGGLPASAFLRADVASGVQAASYINTAAVASAASQLASTPAIVASGASAGYLPVFTDAAGDIGNSLLYQSNGNIGVGTTSPGFPMHFVSQGPSNAVVAVDGYGATTGVAFIGRHARGTMAAPAALMANDNIFTIQGRGYYSSADGTNQGFSPSSRAFIKIFAAENWTDIGQGAYISFATTPAGTNPGSSSATEKMRLTDMGYLGIGTTTPASPLSVNGTIQSITGGFKFPDGSLQVAAALVPPTCSTGQMLKWNGSSWGCFTSLAASSISLGSGLLGNLTNNLLTLNTDTTYLQQRVSNSCAAGTSIASIGQGGTVSCQQAGALATTLGSGLTGSIANNLLTLNTDSTYLQRRVSGLCPSGNAIAQVLADGTVACQTVAGGGTLNLPVYWTGTVLNPPAGVLNVTDTTNGPASPQNGPPDFSTVPSAIVGTATGTGITAGVRGQAAGADGVGVFAYTTTSSNPTLVVWNGLTGADGKTVSYPQAMLAAMANAGGTVISAQAMASAAPICPQGANSCSQTSGVSAEVGAATGQAVAFQGNLNSPSATGLQLNFGNALTTGSVLNASYGNTSFFQVDGGGSIRSNGGATFGGQVVANGGLSVSGNTYFGTLNVNNGLGVNGSTVLNGTVNLNNGLAVIGQTSLLGSLNVNNNIVAQQGFSVTNGANMFNIDAGGNTNTQGSITATGNIMTNANAIVGLGLTTNGGGGVMINNGALTVTSGGANNFIAGNLNVGGNLAKAGGSFKIDHPLDPANKYLSHSFVESPDMMNIYNGVVTLDKRGEAWVQMPDYFEALNADFRYQLTAIGSPGPKLYIAQKVSGNRFKIAGGKHGMEVSWQVTGVRHDAWANEHRIPVEEVKQGEERGTYLHPELFNKEQYVAEKK